MAFTEVSASLLSKKGFYVILSISQKKLVEIFMKVHSANMVGYAAEGTEKAKVLLKWRSTTPIEGSFKCKILKISPTVSFDMFGTHKGRTSSIYNVPLISHC